MGVVIEGASGDVRDTARLVVVIAGPTASGKSALALDLAARFDGTVVNADAMQVYRGIEVLTDQPDAAAQVRLPHLLFGFLDPTEPCSAGRWSRLATAAIAEARARGRLPVVVGGTGFYLNALMRGLAPIPEVPSEVQAEAGRTLARLGQRGLHARLAAEDPAMAARIAPADTQRVRRAWEVLLATGRSLSSWQKEPETLAVAGRFVVILVDPDRAAVREAVAARLRRMVAGGALDEVRRLIAIAGDDRLPARKALGVRELADHLAGRASLAEAEAATVAATCRYAKRQATWFRHQLRPDVRIGEKYSESHGPGIFAFISASLLTLDG
ncbi:MAG: tRNA (adenosine(37)-N6)-dimethylallyltransferase MiaA [Alphaproteobacteria bacterium]|nr:tRNA (adenosine(37)-N6)-dimethylallyltransferase MiaA [Alphaproteobacteria bacterium]